MKTAKIIPITMNTKIQYPMKNSSSFLNPTNPTNRFSTKSSILCALPNGANESSLVKTMQPNPVKNQLTFQTNKKNLLMKEVNTLLQKNSSTPPLTNTKLQYAVVIPCYNEEKRLPAEEFLQFAAKNPDVVLCFVNDGSKDDTLKVLRKLQADGTENIYVHSLIQNSGKAEAVRQGMLFAYENFSIDLIGFLDADLATKPEEWLQMAKYKAQYPQFGAIVGSRIQRLGAAIKRNDNRSFMSSIIKKIIRVILKTPFQDTQCGAKIFNRSIIPSLFGTPFMTPWLFDVEIFLRLQTKFGKTTLQKGVLEFPLMQWSEIGDSKLKFKDSIKIPMQLMNLYYHYHVAKKFSLN